MSDFRSSLGYLPLFLGVAVLGPAAAACAYDGAWVVAAVLGVACLAVLWLAGALYRGERHVPRHQGRVRLPVD